MRNRGKYVAILNGFDLCVCASEHAFKVERLYIALTQANYNPQIDKIEFKIIGLKPVNGTKITLGSAGDSISNDIHFSSSKYPIQESQLENPTLLKQITSGDYANTVAFILIILAALLAIFILGLVFGTKLVKPKKTHKKKH